jgi:hypothetical protein
MIIQILTVKKMKILYLGYDKLVLENHKTQGSGQLCYYRQDAWG